MEKENRLLITGKREFIAPCLGTAYVSDGEEVERNVMISRISYKIQKSVSTAVGFQASVAE